MARIVGGGPWQMTSVNRKDRIQEKARWLSCTDGVSGTDGANGLDASDVMLPVGRCFRLAGNRGAHGGAPLSDQTQLGETPKAFTVSRFR